MAVALGAALTSTVAWRRWAPRRVAVGLVAATLIRDHSPARAVRGLSAGRGPRLLRGGASHLPFGRGVTARALVLAALPSIWLPPGDPPLVDAGLCLVVLFFMSFLAGRVMASETGLTGSSPAKQPGWSRTSRSRRGGDGERAHPDRPGLADVVAHNVSVMAIQRSRLAPLLPPTPSRRARHCMPLRHAEEKRRGDADHGRLPSSQRHGARRRGAPVLGQSELCVERNRIADADVTLQVRGRPAN